MNTVFQTGPGFFAANTNEGDSAVPKGRIRILCARLEAYDLEIKNESDMDDIKFEVLFAKAEGKPQLAKAMLALADAINGNRAMLEAEAKK
jgi:hypothetical protein